MASGTESATETSYWIKFFTEAQIPAGDAAHYAVLFSDNRIQRGMLLDLTKEYLIDMGITRLGDVIAVLKHAKAVHSQDAKDKVLKGAKFTSPASSASASPLRRSTAASRMVGHHLAKTPDSGPMNQLPPKPQVTTNSAGKSSVFDRLGSDSPGSGNSPKTGGPGDSVFNRLGGKGALKRSTSSASPADSDDEGVAQSPLEYQGIMKYPTVAKKSAVVPRKKVRVTVDDSVKVTGLDNFKVTGLDNFKVTGRDRARVSPKPSSFDMSDIQSLKVQVSSTTATPKAKAKRRTTMPVTSSLDDMLASAKILSIQKEEVTTTTTKPAARRSQGMLSMDAPESANVKTRLGHKVQTAPASSTTSDFRPSAKKPSASDVRSRLGAKSPQQKASTSKLTVTASVSAQSKASSASGVFSRLGKKTAVS
ncbi:uncharacterized protein C19orf47-like isoform X1 [Littorina saxatilis]|uniref:SAM domain-containing protein n=1 Tax=Littorina saxatilis TaxID=31220 RepID=A0AAN9GEI5_9CAEN